VPGVLVYRFSAPLFFANSEAFVESAQALLVAAGEEGNLPHTMVIDFEEIFLIDGNGATAIMNLFEYAQRYDIDLAFARVHENTRQIMEILGVIDELGEDRFYPTVRSAVDAVTAKHAPPATG